jgi:hypothetical protein
MAQAEPAYPVQFDVDYPDRNLNRLTTFFRLFTVIPIAIVLTAVSGGSSYSWAARDETYAFGAGVGGILFVAPLLLIVFRQKYPRWWFDWNLNFARFENRVVSYLLLLRDEYPSTDEEQAVQLEFPYPDARNELNRWLPLVKWLLAIPHYVVLFFLAIAAFVCVVISWFANSVHRALSPRAVRLRRRGDALGEPCPGLRVRADHRPVPALQARCMTGPRERIRSREDP